jgi:hypothetical protein
VPREAALYDEGDNAETDDDAGSYA